MLKRLRSQPAVNAVVRSAIANLASRSHRAVDWLTARWRVAGQVPLEILGHRLLMNADADDAIVNKLYYRQEWEAGELRAWCTLVKEARTVLDIGANTGVYAILSAMAQPKARIFAFEPHPSNFTRLVANVATNRLANVETIEQAVGDTTGSVSFTVPADGQISLVSSAVRMFTEAHYGIPYRQENVRQTTIDAFIAEKQLGVVDIIKIDVEYYELSVLRGGLETLRKQGPVILCEVFDYEIFSHQRPELKGKISATQHLEVQELLTHIGYNFYYVGKDGLHRVSDLQSSPDGGSNFVFSRVRTTERFLPWSSPDAIRALTGHHQ